MSEATTLITTRMSRLPSTSGDVGHPPEGIISVDIVDDNDRVVENGTIGEIRVTGQGLMLGYLNRRKRQRKGSETDISIPVIWDTKNLTDHWLFAAEKQNS